MIFLQTILHNYLVLTRISYFKMHFHSKFGRRLSYRSNSEDTFEDLIIQ